MSTYRKLASAIGKDLRNAVVVDIDGNLFTVTGGATNADAELCERVTGYYDESPHRDDFLCRHAIAGVVVAFVSTD